MTQSQPPRITRALAVQGNLSPFGNKVVQSGLISPDDMQKALVQSRQKGMPLVEAIEALTGKSLPPALVREYKVHQLFELKILYGVESLDPEINPVTNNEMAELIDTLIPIDVCRRYKLLPLQKKDTQPPSVLIAMVNPDNLDAQDDLKRILRSQGHGIELQRMVFTTDDYEKLLHEYLESQVKQQKQQEVNKAVDVSSDIANMAVANLDDAPDDTAEIGNVNEAQQAPIVNLVNKILIKGLQEKVSDIHVEPQEECLRIRYRKDGVLREGFEPLPKQICTAVSARFKIMADLDIAERRMPQDGKIRRMFEGRPVDFRVNSLPSRWGEKICLRILDNSSTQLGLDKLISDPETLAKVREIASRPFGLILVTGPTGSGKSTSLYSVLAERNSPGVNISTAEDPIEYTLPGITQVQVIREKGMDFAQILRAFMRQDPDVILVGETRDKETAKTAMEAALTGHLVLTTLHTNDAAGAIARLDEMGIEPFMISGALLGVLAQRLMRKVCSECRIPYKPTAQELARYGMTASKDGEITIYKANTLTGEQIAEAKAKGNLCPNCNGVGYRGRVGVYEFMIMSENLQKVINEGGTTDMVKELAVQEGMVTILAYSLNLVRQGLTTFDEVDRVTFTDSGLEAELKAQRKVGLTCKVCEAGLQPDWIDCPYCLTPRFKD